MSSWTTIIAIVSMSMMFASVSCSRVQVEGIGSNVRLPAGWRLVKDATIDQDQRVEVYIYLKLNNVEQLEKLFWEVSNTSHVNYGKHLSHEQVKQMTGPSEGHTERVIHWLKREVLREQIQVSKSGDIITVSATAKQIEALFDVSLQVFQHKGVSTRVYRAMDRYTVPESVSSLIHHIAGVNTFPNYDRAHNMKKQFDTIDSHSKVAAGSNAPRILRSRNGDGQLPLFVLPVCKDGSLPTTSGTPCSSSDQATTLVAEISFNSSRGSETTTVNIDLPKGSCKLCSEWRGFWNVLCSGAAPGQDVVTCNVPLKGIRNYSPQSIKYHTKYASGATSTELEYAVKIWGGQLATPASLSAFYGVPVGTRGTSSKNNAAVAEFLGQFYSPQDLKLFLAHNDLPDATPFVIGPNNPGIPGGEATLDIEYLMGMAPGVAPVFWSVALENAQIEPFHKWMVEVLNNQSTTWVHSVSYGDDEIDLTNEQMQRLNQEFMKAGVRGMTILFASGDDGVSDTPVRTNVSECYRFRPSFPPTSPYVTAVGATMWSNKNRALCNQNDHGFDFMCNGLGEIVSDSFTGSGITSGGGFSDIFDMPQYQQDAVNNYLSTFKDSLPPQKFFNKAGRAYPDVSGIGHNFIVRWNDTSIQIDGTSASTPLVASLVALLNDARFNTNKSAMGFINPWLYQIAAKTPTAFFDVTQGNNRCSALADHCCEYGYEAVPGFDAAVGLGTPNYAVWKTLVLNPDSAFPSAAGDQRTGRTGPAGPRGPSTKLMGTEQGFIFNFSVIVSFMTLAVMLVVVIAVAWHRFGGGDSNGTELRDRSGLMN